MDRISERNSIMEQIAMYLRLSKEDEYVKDESNSIKNQRSYIRRFINSDEELRNMDVLEFVDDGYSGKNMERPQLQSMLSQIKEHKISCVIVKDFSRFSRDHIVQGKYIEQIFPFMGVRFISINDNYDSKDHVGGIGEIDVAFSGLLYDFYSEDLSEKVSAALKTRRSNGSYISAAAPYGYVKSEENRHLLIPDEYSADIVKRIFAEYIAGASTYQIAKGLNEEGIESPGVYIARRDKNDKCLNRYLSKKPVWNPLSVGRILGNEQYTGVVVYNKSKTENVGDKHAKALPSEEWKCVPDTHEAIISREDFDKAARMRKEKHKESISKAHERHCLAGKLVCGNCGHHMAHTYKGRPKYYCAKYFLDKSDEKCNIRILDADIENIVKSSLQEIIDGYIDSKEVRKKQEANKIQQFKDAQDHLASMELSLEKINDDLRSAYESFKLGITDKNTYINKKNACEKTLQEMRANIEKQKAAVAALSYTEVSNVAGFDIVNDDMKINVLTRDMVDTFLDEIVINYDNSIEVRWKFKNEL